MTHERVPIGSVHEDPANVRRHPDRNVAAVKASLARFGQQRPILVGPTGVVIAGNCTLAAARALGWSEIDVVRTDLVGAEAVAYAIADNRTAELAEFDEPALLAQIEELPLDLQEASGWELPEIEELRLEVEGPAEVEEDEAPEPLPDAKAQRGDIITLGRHRVMCGDSTCAEDVEALFAGERVGLVVADPPYCSGGFQEAGRKGGSVGTRGSELIHNDQLSTRGYQALIRRVMEVAQPSLAYLFTDWRQWASLFDVMEASGLGVRSMVVWDKQTPGMGRGWRNQHELIMCGSRESQPFDPHQAQGNVIQCKRTGNVLHATEKPVELIGKILTVSDMHPDVFDPFLGSGTTLIAADQLSRRCFGMDCEPRYTDVQVKRWLAYCVKAGRAPEVTGWRGS